MAKAQAKARRRALEAGVMVKVHPSFAKILFDTGFLSSEFARAGASIVAPKFTGLRLCIHNVRVGHRVGATLTILFLKSDTGYQGGGL